MGGKGEREGKGREKKERKKRKKKREVTAEKCCCKKVFPFVCAVAVITGSALTSITEDCQEVPKNCAQVSNSNVAAVCRIDSEQSIIPI